MFSCCIGYTNCLDLLLSGHTKSGQYLIDPDGNGSVMVRRTLNILR